MSYNVQSGNSFEREAKRLIKKFPSLKRELNELIDQLVLNPTLGTNLGKNIFKIRLAIASKGKGKSSGARVITFIYVEKNIVFLLAIYDKSERSTISIKEIHSLITEIL